MKKGPRIAKKRDKPIMTVDDLDKEMDAYRREAKFTT